MRASPFDADDTTSRQTYRNLLAALINSNRHVGNRIAGLDASGEQITKDMKKTRNQSIEMRKNFYQIERVKDQQDWYAHKSEWNKKKANSWTVAAVAVYVTAGILVIMRVAYPTWKIWPIEPLIVIAAAIVGWVQTKRFSELSASYGLTAHEIGIIASRFPECKTGADFSELVNDAEMAFSREHTQWLARQAGS
jgi:hypothetical protein